MLRLESSGNIDVFWQLHVGVAGPFLGKCVISILQRLHLRSGMALYHGTARELGPGNAIEYFCADQWTAVITPSAQLCVCSWGMFRPRARFIQELVGVVCIAIFR